MRATIYDVASEAEVSITTVSRYLNTSSNVKESTGKRISKAMTKLNYVPQGNTGPRNHRVKRIGILTPFFPAPSFSDRLRGIIPPLKEQNYEVVVYTIESADQLDEYLSSVPFTRHLDGIILMSVKLSAIQRRTLLATKIEVVLVESNEKEFTRILIDDRRGGAIAAELFIQKNYFPCAYMGDVKIDLSYSCQPTKNRLIGFKETLVKAKYELEESMTLTSATTVEDAQRVFEDFLSKNRCPRAIFAMSDLQAIGILKAAQKNKIQVPGDLAILGFDDIEAAEWLNLSTISQQLKLSGKEAADTILKQINNFKTNKKNTLDLILRERGTT